MTHLRMTLLALFVLSCTGVSLASPGPMAQARSTVDSVMEILRNRQGDALTQRRQLSSAIRDRFEFSAMAQRILAVNWRKASSEQRQRFTALLSELLERSYLERIEAYTDEKVEFVKEKVEGDRAQIDTLIVTRSVDIPVTYRMLQQDGEWKVYDVVIESVSFVSNYRSSYRQIVKSQGLDGLLALMQQKLDQLKQSDGSRQKP